MNELSEGFKGCPFCGAVPEVSNMGTCIEIECCVSMSFQKCDILSRDEWHSHDLDDITLLYPEVIEKKLLESCKKEWNHRTPVD